MAELTRGWNSSQVAALKNKISEQFEALGRNVGILDEIQSTVQSTWHGPDAEKYLDAVFQYFQELVDEVSKAEAGMKDTISNMETKWEAFQNQ